MSDFDQDNKQAEETAIRTLSRIATVNYAIYLFRIAAERIDYETGSKSVGELAEEMIERLEKMLVMRTAIERRDLTIGTHVEKIGGYKWPGVIVADFVTTAGKRRLVVECTAPDVAGALHIYAPDQVKPVGSMT